MMSPLLIYRRQLLEQHIEAMIALLDMVDGDENLEPELAGFDPRFMNDLEGDDEREDCDFAELDPAEEDFPSQIGGGIGL